MFVDRVARHSKQQQAVVMTKGRIEFQVQEGKVRLDKFLAEKLPDLSRSAAQRLIDSGQVTVNGDPVPG